MAGRYHSRFVVGSLTLLLAVVACTAESKAKSKASLVQHLVKRQSAITMECPGYSANYQNPSDCSSYYECINNQVRRVPCVSGQVFDPLAQKCGNYRIPAGCTPSNRQGFQPASYVCPRPNGRFQDTADCSRYYECSNSRATRQQCPQQQLFDPNAEACSNIHDPEGCHMPGTGQIPPPQPIGQGDYQCPSSHGHFHDTTDCSRYYVCSHWQPERRQCPPGQLYDPDFEVCSNSVQPEGCHMPGGLQGSGAFRCQTAFGDFQDTTDCSRFWRCNNFQATSQQCGANQLFDIATFQCSNSISFVAGCTMPPNWNPSQGSAAAYVCPQPDGRFQDTADCSRYYECSNSRATRQQCPQQQLFDPNAEACSNIHDPEGCHMPGTGQIPAPQLIGQGDYQCPSSHGQFHDTTDCSRYYVCSHWQPERRQCPPGQFYDPDFEVCSNSVQPEGCHMPGGLQGRASFSCPASFGNYQDQSDCSKYWSCSFGQATSNTCQVNQLFDNRSLRCSATVTFVNGCTMPSRWNGGVGR